MTDRSGCNDSIGFGHVIFEEIEKLESCHPLVYKSFSRGEHKPTHFHTLPHCPDIDDGFPCYFYLYDNDKIISSFATLPDKLYINGETRRWAWAGALLTDPACRGRGLGTLIIKQSVKVLHEKDIAWGGVFSTRAALHIYDKLGFTMPGFAHRYLFLKSARSVFKYHLKSGLLATPADLIYRATVKTFLGVINRPLKPVKLDVHAARIDLSGNDALDIDLPDLYYHTKYHFNDSLPKLKWKARSSRYNALYIMESASTCKPLCYFVLKNRPIKQPILGKYKDFNLMTLMDYGVYDSDAKIYEMLINLVFNLFWESDAEVLEIISSSGSLISFARRIGMKKAGKGMSYVFTAPPGWNLGAESGNPQKWPLTYFCGDAYSFA